MAMMHDLQLRQMTVSTMATIYGCCGLFDLCSDQDLLSLSLEGTNPFIDWLGWEKSNECVIKKNFITWVRPAAAGGVRSIGYVADACGDSNGAEWGYCDFTLTDYARLRRHGPVRDATEGVKKYCEIQPRYRLDGTMITNDAEYDMRVVMEAMLQDLKLMLVTGNKATPGMFSGLETLVNTNYVDSLGNNCNIMDSIVINWNHNTLSGGSGVTWNGAAVASTYDFIDVLQAAFRRILDRIRYAPALSTQPMSVGDIVLVAPTHVLRCIMDAFTCWSVCPGQQYNETNLNTYEARTYRNSLMGGMFGAGRIYLDGFEVPLMPYEWGLIKGPLSSDVYLLTGKIGSVRLINGQYADLSAVPAQYPEASYSYTDGGRFLTWLERDKTCLYREVEFQPRLLMWAPWAQARIQNVKCAALPGVISPDPWETSFFPETSFFAPVCP